MVFKIRGCLCVRIPTDWWPVQFARRHIQYQLPSFVILSFITLRLKQFWQIEDPRGEHNVTYNIHPSIVFLFTATFSWQCSIMDTVWYIEAGKELVGVRLLPYPEWDTPPDHMYPKSKQIMVSIQLPSSQPNFWWKIKKLWVTTFHGDSLFGCILQIWDSSIICGATSICEDHGFELGSYAGGLIIWKISLFQFRNLKLSSNFLLRPVWRQDLSSWSCCGLWYHPPLARSTKSWST